MTVTTGMVRVTLPSRPFRVTVARMPATRRATFDAFVAGTLTTSDLVDALVDAEVEVRSCETQFVQYGARPRFTGPVRTVRCDRDNGLVKKALNSPGEGAVLVVDGGACLYSALMGDMIAEAAVANGWAGVIINGPVRDVRAIASLELGVKALCSSPRKSAKDAAGETDVPVTFGGVTFASGDVVWSDEDEIVVV